MLAAAARGLLGPGGFLGFPDGVHQCGQLIGTGGAREGAKVEAEDFPAARGGQPLRVQLAQVIAVRLGVGCQRSQDGGGIGIYVRQGSDGGLPAR